MLIFSIMRILYSHFSGSSAQIFMKNFIFLLLFFLQWSHEEIDLPPLPFNTVLSCEPNNIYDCHGSSLWAIKSLNGDPNHNLYFLFQAYQEDDQCKHKMTIRGHCSWAVISYEATNNCFSCHAINGVPCSQYYTAIRFIQFLHPIFQSDYCSDDKKLIEESKFFFGEDTLMEYRISMDPGPGYDKLVFSQLPSDDLELQNGADEIWFL